MKLYSFFRSSASYRVRIALGLKGLAYDYHPVDLRSEQDLSAYLSVNPQGLVPALEDQGDIFIQSLAIIEYLEETHPQPPLLPSTAAQRARVRGLAQVVACEIHPLDNLRVLNYLGGPMKQGEEVKLAWYRHWIAVGLGCLEALLKDHPATGRFCHGDSPTLADICLVPQLYNARRFQCELSPYPTLLRIDAACAALPAFQNACPEAQPDAG
ncbi:MAG: maleylacetoacetate isomerase [Deltaproteobacteria bacterium]|jgi:maleylpyruvate isomerase|nr:maleylacetoacetate isomerase [Deltaproteobacteria bacterium]